MPLAIHVSPDGWGGSRPEDIEAVARSAAETLVEREFDDTLVIDLGPTASDEDPPIALLQRGPGGEFLIRLPIRGNLWARLAFQFAHEFCHVLADPGTVVFDRFTWIEEVLCEVASLFALGHMAVTWLSDPPYANWRDYSPALSDYLTSRVAEPEHCLPAGESLQEWLARTLPTLEVDFGRRADNTLVAKELLPIFEATEGSWGAMRSLHRAPRSAGSLADYLDGWAAVSKSPSREVVRAIKTVIASG